MNSHAIEHFGYMQKMDLLEQARISLQGARNLPGSHFLTTVLSPQRINANLTNNDTETEEEMERHSSNASPDRPMSGADSPSRMELAESSDCRSPRSASSPNMRSPQTDACMSMDDGADADDDEDDDISVGSPPSPPAPSSISSPSVVSQTTPSTQVLLSPIPSPASLIAPSPISLNPSTSAAIPPLSVLSANNTPAVQSNITSQHLSFTNSPSGATIADRHVDNNSRNENTNNNYNPSDDNNQDVRNSKCNINLGSSMSSPNMASQSSPASKHLKVEPIDPDLIARTPPAAHQAPSPQNQPTQRQLKFSIDNILKPEFGSRRLGDETSESQQPVDLSRDLGRDMSRDMSRMLSPGRAAAVPARVATPLSTDTNKLSSDTELWPAWVFCTRYSDRPSAGKD